MQITNSFSQATPSHNEGVDMSDQIRRLQGRQRRILFFRSFGFWWYRILIVALAVIATAVLGQFAFTYPKEVFGGMVAIMLFCLAVRRIQFGILLAAIFSTTFLPKAFALKSLDVYPVIPLLLLLFTVIMLQTIFHVKKFVWPSFWVIWPQFGIILLAILSTVMIQFTWVLGVPRKINTNPIIFDEIFGILEFLLPLLTVAVTTACLTKNGRWITYILRTFLVLALLAAVVIIVDFRRIGADIYTFRFSEPSIGWMTLRSLAQLLGMGAMLIYARFLYPQPWHLTILGRKVTLSPARVRLVYLLALAICLASVYFTLENSWWLEVATALLVMTLLFSPRLVATLAVLALPFVPLLKGELAKLQQAKSADYYRLIIWQDALRLWHMRPWLGVGPGNFWTYDQRFTQLPIDLRDFNKTGLGVAHNGYLQMLGELGPLGVLCLVSFIVVMAVISIQLYRRSFIAKKKSDNVFGALLNFIGLYMPEQSEKRTDRILALVGFGLICGSAVGDFFSGSFFLQPRQVGSSPQLSQVIMSWIVWGCIIYKDKLWRMRKKGMVIED